MAPGGRSSRHKSKDFGPMNWPVVSRHASAIETQGSTNDRLAAVRVSGGLERLRPETPGQLFVGMLLDSRNW